MTQNGTCMNEKGKLHSVYWNYHNPEFSDDGESITVDGTCQVCNVELQKTYSNSLLSIISKSTGEVSNFDYLVEHLN